MADEDAILCAEGRGGSGTAHGQGAVEIKSVAACAQRVNHLMPVIVSVVLAAGTARFRASAYLHCGTDIAAGEEKIAVMASL